MYKYLPTSDGGFIRKSTNNMTKREEEFVLKTADLNPLVTGDATKYQLLAKELLFTTVSSVSSK